ncbi:unnamed protein product [Heligmosomoides polygyrus]|uniref:SOCS box domain-containing protein n=1 Tax=Heligmosomoides polygyrus TaxID=6339 RepID=A0A183F8Z3_HELPZ|nr:unnamed protein product [Heligmosomoides polygyrus]
MHTVHAHAATTHEERVDPTQQEQGVHPLHPFCVSVQYMDAFFRDSFPYPPPRDASRVPATSGPRSLLTRQPESERDPWTPDTDRGRSVDSRTICADLHGGSQFLYGSCTALLSLYEASHPFTLQCLTVLLLVNRRLTLITRGQRSLSYRYQISENVRALRYVFVLLDTSVCAVDMIGSQLFQVHPAFEGGVYKSSPSYLPAYIVLRFVRSPLIVLQQSSCLAKQIFLGSNRSARSKDRLTFLIYRLPDQTLPPPTRCHFSAKVKNGAKLTNVEDELTRPSTTKSSSRYIWLLVDQ